MLARLRAVAFSEECSSFASVRFQDAFYEIQELKQKNALGLSKLGFGS